MAYTATLIAFDRVRDEWRISIRYDDTDTGKSLIKHYRRDSITKAQLRTLARNEAEDWVNHATTDVDVPIGTTIDVTPPTPQPPTQAQIDKAAWLADYQRLRSMLALTEAVPALLTTQAQTAIDNLRTSLAAGWLNSYLGDI